MFWKSFFHLSKKDTSYIPNMNSDPLPSIPPIQIHTEGAAQLLHSIQAYKANGPNNLPAHFIKEIANKITPVLTIIFQAYLDPGSLPAIWKTAVVVPTYIFLRRKRNLTHATTGQYYSSAFAQRSWNT